MKQEGEEPQFDPKRFNRESLKLWAFMFILIVVAVSINLLLRYALTHH